MFPEESITLEQVEQLLDLAAARDQRSTDPADHVAWWTDLNVARVSFADAKLALAKYYAEVWPRQDPRHRFRATAPTLIETVRDIRKQRHEKANFVYEPDPDETGAEYARRKQAQLRAVGDGCVPAYSTAELSPRPVAALVAGVASARALPPEIADVLAPRRSGPRSIRCPRCSAAPRVLCTNGNGKPMDAPHPARIDAHAVQTADCPECYANAGDGCREMGEPYPGGAHPGRVKAASKPNDPTEGA
jgi:hypothetical protein